LIRIAALGEGLLVEGTPSDEPIETARSTALRARSIAAALPDADVVAGGARVLVLGASEDTLRVALDRDVALETLALPRHHPIEVAYDGADLAHVAERAGCDAEEVVRAHSDRVYTALVAGFLPGFAYLGPVDPRLALPRRDVPRARVPAGSVAVAAGMTGIYPHASPGGWWLLGRALDAKLFDLARTPSRRIAPLDTVEFRPVRAPALRPASAPRSGSSDACRVHGAAVRIERCNFATIQDGGRRGLRGEGIPWSGALDPALLARANLAVGNATDDAAIELVQGGLALRAEGAIVVSVDGAPARRLHEGEPLAIAPHPDRAVRYVALRGGVDVPRVLDSRATLRVAGLGGLEGRALQRGDRLAIGPDPGTRPRVRPVGSELRASDVVELRAWPAPPDERLGGDAFGVLLGATYAVGQASDRLGIRLEGPRLRVERAGRPLPEPVLPGCVQVTNGGELLVLGPDAAVTGGYPVVAAIDGPSLAALAQRRPGRLVRFTRT